MSTPIISGISTNSKYNIFAENKDANDAVRVGYIHPRKGYISGLSVYAANTYAEANPGTQFIIANRDKVRYININEVNKLKNKDTLPTNRPHGLVDEETGEFDPCNTVRGFKTDPTTPGGGEPEITPNLDQPNQSLESLGANSGTDITAFGKYNTDNNYKKYGSEGKRRTRIEIQGGGGIGALAVPIIGPDGAITAARVIHGGFGYKFPPQVRIFDDYKRGSGATGESVLGESGFRVENFDDEDDVENYNFKLGQYEVDIANLDWGKDYSMSDQTVIGEWNPSNVLSLEDNEGFVTQLQEYLRFLKGYDPNKPWWTTRDETPVNVTGDGTKKIANKLGGILFPVEHWAWGGSNVRDDLFVDVEFEVYGQGTYKNRNIFFKFKAEDGSHQFRVKGVTHEKRSGKKRTQLVSLKANTNYTVTSNVRKNIKNADSLNVEQGLLEEGGRAPKEAGELQRSGGKSKIIFADVVGSANDNDDIQVISNIGSFRAGSRKKISFDSEGIQNKNIKIKKNIDNLEARQTDLLRELEVERNDAARERVDAVTAELQEALEKKKILRKKLNQIEANKKNRYQRGTFDLTYRLNRRKEITSTKTIQSSFMNKYAVAPQLPSNREGTDKADKPYSLMYKEYFPHDGEYTFKGAADNVGEVFLDNVSIMDISNTFKNNQVKKKLNVLKGDHEIRIDLLNAAQKKIITETYTADGGRSGKGRTVKFNVVGSGSGRHRKISAVFTNKTDTSDNFTIDNDGQNKKVRTVHRRVTSGANYDVKFIATAPKIDANEERIIPIDIAAPGTKGRGEKAKIGNVERKKIKYLDESGDDTNATLSIDSTSPGLSAKFSDDGSSIITKGNGDLSLKFKWNDDPRSAGKAVGQLKVDDKTFKQVGEKGEQIETIDIGKKIPRSKDSYLEQGCVENGTKNKESRGSSNRIFADYIGSANDNDDMQIFMVKGGIFTSSNAKRTPGLKEGGNGRNTFDIEFVFDVASYGLKGKLWQELKDVDIVDDKTGESLERSDIQKSLVFNTKDYIDKANRSLFRVRPGVRKFGDFFTKNAVTPFNPLEIDPEIKSVPPTVPEPQSFTKPKVKFQRSGGPNGELFMEVIGDGKARIGFKLDVNDNLTTSGLAVRDIRIESDGGNIDLKRNIKNVNLGGGQNRFVGKEKEKIKGSGEFTAGKTYKVTASGGSSTSGFKTVDNTIVFDDDYQNGWDKNAGLEIDYIRAIDPPKSKPAKPPRNGQNNSSKKSLESIEGSALAYAGTHEIVWKNIEFPASGTYTIDVQVDDNVRLEIFNNQFKAQILDVKGFRGVNAKSNGLQTFPLEVRQGKYTIKALLQQLPGKSIVDGNPMGLAVNIKTAYVEVEKEIIIRRSWNQNPFGAALTIHAPPPPIPQEPQLVQEGPCPPNPIWTTRHEAEVEQWHPCSHRFPDGSRSWSKFMNRYAMSPVLPIGTKGSGYSGQSWDNTWLANIPYTGFYNFKGTVDNFAKCTITQEPDNSEVESKTVQNIKKINKFATEKSGLTSNKIFLTKGKAQIDINVRNGERIKYRQVTKKVFNTKDWVTKSTVKDKPIRVPVEFKVYGQGSKTNMEIKAIFKEKGGNHTFTINNVEKNKATESISKKVKRNTDYKVTFVGTPKTTTTKIAATPAPVNTERVYPIEVAAPGSKGRGTQASIGNVEDKKIRYLDEDGDDPNATLSIESTSPGATAKFSGDGSELEVTGNGDVTLKLKWDDNPNSAGIAVGELKVGGKTFRQKGKKGDQTETITVGKSNSGSAVASNASSGTKEILFKFSHDDANDGNRIKIPGLSINSVKPSGSKGDFDPEESTATVENGKVYVVEFVTENKAFLKLKDDGKTIWCNDNSDNDDKDAVITTSDGTFFDLVDGGDNGQPSNIGRAKFRFGKKSTPTPITTTTDGGVVEQGTLLDNKFGKSDVKNEQGQDTESNTVFADYVRSKNDNNDMMIQCTAGIFTPSNKHRTKKETNDRKGRKIRRGTWDLTFRFDDRVFTTESLITNVDGAKYDIRDKELSRTATTRAGTNNNRIVENTAPVIQNPTLTTYKRGTLGPFLSPFFLRGTREGGTAMQGRTWEMVWENVDFPIDGNYKIEIEADDILKVLLGTNLKDSFGESGYKEIANVSTNKGIKTVNTRLSSGKHDIKLILNNLSIPGTSFQENPVVAACKITCEIPLELADQRSWLINPVGVSAVLLAPPCERVVGGIGTVREIIITKPGNTYTPDTGGEGIPSQVIITDIVPLKPGIGYTAGDTISIVGIANDIPITVGDFGKVTGVIIPDRGEGDGGTSTGIGPPPAAITTYPKILIQTTTGVGFVPSIRTELIVDTPAADPDTVIQVTDLAGLKQTGYVEGRAYYGEVFFKDGTPFAGRYETAGKLIQVYATLQESIDSEVTTRPSAIQRSGTDINSNNPRLNIPGTPNNLT